MPQMAPLLWSIMFTFFSILLIFSLTKIFFYGEPSIPLSRSNSTFMSYKKSWQW